MGKRGREEEGNFYLLLFRLRTGRGGGGGKEGSMKGEKEP